jgi:uncharacterized membrane protein YvbJ
VQCGPFPVFAIYTLASALQLRKKHGKTSARVAARTTQADTVQYKNNEQYNIQKKNSNTEQLLMHSIVLVASNIFFLVIIVIILTFTAVLLKPDFSSLIFC